MVLDVVKGALLGQISPRSPSEGGYGAEARVSRCFSKVSWLGLVPCFTVFLESELVGACPTRVLRCFSKVSWFGLNFLVPVEEISKVGWLGLVL